MTGNTDNRGPAATRRRVLGYAGAGTVMATLGRPDLAFGRAALPRTVEALIPAAKDEPGATMFGLSVPADSAAGFKAEMNAFYGFELDISMTGGMHPVKAAEIAQLQKRGISPDIDCFYTSIGTSIVLRDAGILVTEPWAEELGVAPDRLITPSMIRILDSALPLMSYNTERTESAELPTRWEDLLDPRWKGRIASPRIPVGAFLYNTYAIGEARMLALIEGLMDHDVIWVARTPESAARLLSGEASLALSLDIGSQLAKGAPLAYVPVQPALITSWGAHLVKGSKSPNLSKLFAYFLSTDVGQEAFGRHVGFSTRDNPASITAKAFEGLGVTDVPAAWINENFKRLAGTYAAAMGLR